MKMLIKVPVSSERSVKEKIERILSHCVLVPILSRVKIVTPIQGNYEYCLWQLGSLQVLIRSSFHGFYHRQDGEGKLNNELISCYAKLEYQPQFGCEQITDEEYRLLWLHSYLRRGSSVILGMHQMSH